MFAVSVLRQFWIANAAFILGTLVLSANATAQEPDWTKPYIGGQLGYSWDNIDVSSNPPGAFSNLGDFGGAIGGIQGGGNFIQQGGLVFGLVTDFNWLDGSAHASTSQSAMAIVDVCGDGCLEETTVEGQTAVGLDLEWKASVRGKVGVLAAPNVLLYATGGIAFARLEANASQSTTVTTISPSQTTTSAGSDNAILTGFVLGAGAEVLVTPAIGVFAQVLHYEFETESLDLLGSTVNVDLDETIAMFGVSFYLN
ncbi:outer membrane immunogenic protein [Filomicrobium insigne]|uniref:Outer membrane immunogenic protein n=1 Tax=Filomicrobium insigne TaxID=418854 RepID=A0A1H0HXZ4_9HYPH|nr:outer membrane immunogenic protein [Filomicrobium insigne]